jgi:hypothetical protein
VYTLEAIVVYVCRDTDAELAACAASVYKMLLLPATGGHATEFRPELVLFKNVCDDHSMLVGMRGGSLSRNMIHMNPGSWSLLMICCAMSLRQHERAGSQTTPIFRGRGGGCCPSKGTGSLSDNGADNILGSTRRSRSPVKMGTAVESVADSSETTVGGVDVEAIRLEAESRGRAAAQAETAAVVESVRAEAAAAIEAMRAETAARVEAEAARAEAARAEAARAEAARVEAARAEAARADAAKAEAAKAEAADAASGTRAPGAVVEEEEEATRAARLSFRAKGAKGRAAGVTAGSRVEHGSAGLDHSIALHEATERAVMKHDEVQKVLAVLSDLDRRLEEKLGTGAIRLIRTAWLLSQPQEYRVERRQDLEALESQGASPSPFLSPEEAVRLLRNGRRGVGVLTYGWLLAGAS